MIFMRFRGPQALNDTYKKPGAGTANERKLIAGLLNQTENSCCQRSGASAFRGSTESRHGSRLGLLTVAVVRSSGDAHAAKFILVILLVEDVPFFTAFED